MAYKQVRLGDYFKFEKGLGYKGEFLSEDSDIALIGMDSHEEGGGYKEGSEKFYTGPFKPEHIAEVGDVIFAGTEQGFGLLASPLIVPESEKFTTYLFSGDVLKAIPLKPDEFSVEYLYNLYRVERFRIKTAYGDTGTTVRRISNDNFAEQIIPLPDLPTQQAINEIIAMFDQQIANNKALSKSLETLAQAIFKSWFIDFDPVKAKMAGEKPQGMDDATASLFPDSMEKSELGLIPEDWNISKLRNHLEVTKGKSYKSLELEKSDTALVTLKSFKRGGGYRFDGLKPFSGKFKPEQIVEPGELVVSFTDVTQAADIIGKPAIVFKNPSFARLVASLDVGIVRPRGNAVGKHYLYQLFSTPGFKNHIGGYTNGTTVLHLGKGALEDFTVALPGSKIMSKYEMFASTAFGQLQALYLENLTLQAIRDSLLPRLISGDLQIPEEMLAS